MLCFEYGMDIQNITSISDRIDSVLMSSKASMISHQHCPWKATLAVWFYYIGKSTLLKKINLNVQKIVNDQNADTLIRASSKD